MSVNVIDALVVTLGLDAADYDRNRARIAEDLRKLREREAQQQKEAQAGWKKTGDAIGSTKNQLFALLSLFGATVGIKEFITSNVQGQAELGRLSKNLDINARRLEAWGVVAREMGGQASDAFNTLQNVAGGLAEAAIKGHSAFTDAARANGVVLTDSSGRLLNYEGVLVNISKRLAQLPRQQAMWLAGQLGVGSMFNQLMLGPDELKKRLDHAESLSKITAESTRHAQELQQQWADVQQRLKEASEVAFMALAPTLEKLAYRLADWLDSIDWDKVLRVLSETFAEVDKVVEEFGGWKVAAEALGAVLALKILSPLLGIVAALGQMIPLIGTAGAAWAGWQVGKAIDEKTGVSQSEAGHAAGRAIASVLAMFGNDDAQASLDLEDFNSHDEAWKKNWRASYSRWSPADRAEFAKDHPEFLRLMKKDRPRGARNNNPGNLNYAGQAGAHLESGKGARFAAFDSMQDGVAALARQLQLYGGRGTDTIDEIVKTYAPGADGNDVAAYVQALTGSTGFKAGQHLNMTDPTVLSALIRGIVNQEGNGAYVSNQDILSGIMAGSKGGALASASRPAVQHTTEVHVGKIEVHTPATDGEGVARDLRRDIQRNGLIAQADTGLD